ncbi:response regulator [Pseudomonas monteilii]|uniref:hypothetical protein n=1 Tax=Pseudomonas monteilii TaxID=76759 RepID=UPI0015FECFFE|nr:hypothetical protein [Pseudomonas monteilii]
MTQSVMVVEDDAALRMLVCEALKLLGLSVSAFAFAFAFAFVFASADAAISSLESGSGAELVIADIQMPGRLDGMG